MVGQPDPRSALGCTDLRLTWTGKASSDLARLHAFLADTHPPAAAQAVQAIVAAVGRLPERPRIGLRLEEFAPREVRRLVVGRYEVRYLVERDALHVLRIWHTREDR